MSFEPPYLACWPGKPGGHVCTLADAVLAQKKRDPAVALAAARGRKKALAKGITGTIKGLGRGQAV